MNTLVLEQNEQGEVAVIDVYQRLANDRILFICGDISNQLATDICSSLILKDCEDTEKKITLFINSEGGDIRNALMIYDMMQIIESPIETVCIGAAFDEASLLLMGGTKGLRLATKNAVIAVSQLVHDWQTQSDMVDAKKLLEQSKFDNKKIMEILSKSSGKPLKQVSQDFERRVFMNASDATNYGFIDRVVKS